MWVQHLIRNKSKSALEKSKNKETYIQVSQQFNSTPSHVHNLAHGKKAKSNKDREILQQLVSHGIIQSIQR